MYTEDASAGSVAYHKLKGLLLLGEVPIGLRLREERLADRLGMSRTPVREALLRLHAEGFLDRHPEGGFKAICPSAQIMHELYDVRRALELFALSHPPLGERHDAAIISELREDWMAIALDEDSINAEFVHLDEDFHQRLATAAGNIQLAGELRRINERIRLVRSQDFIAPGRIVATIRQHLAILEAVCSDDLGRAAMLLDVHISESQDVVEAASARVLERMLSVGERDSSW